MTVRQTLTKFSLNPGKPPPPATHMQKRRKDRGVKAQCLFASFPLCALSLRTRHAQPSAHDLYLDWVLTSN